MKVPGKTKVMILAGTDDDTIKEAVRQSGIPRPRAVKVTREGERAIVRVSALDVEL